MASKDFNAFMDSYIDNIRDKNKNSFSTQKKKEQKQEIDVMPNDISSDSVYIIKKPKTTWEKIKEIFTSTDEEKFKEQPREEIDSTSKEETEFEQEYEEIKTEEKKSGFIEWLKSLFASNVNDTYEELDEIPAEEVAKVIQEDSINKETTDENEQIEDIREEKKGFFAKILDFFGISVEDDEYEQDQTTKEKVVSASEQEIIEMKQDMKDVAIISTAAFKRLPKEQFKLFKESNDFAKFKVILKKHGIIKEKGE